MAVKHPDDIPNCTSLPQTSLHAKTNGDMVKHSIGIATAPHPNSHITGTQEMKFNTRVQHCKIGAPVLPKLVPAYRTVHMEEGGKHDTSPTFTFPGGRDAAVQ